MRAYSNISRYNIPVFEIAPHVTASKTYHEIVLNYCDILPIMRNVTFNNNRLQWLRIVDTNNNPFFTDPPAIEVHLCSLYITPGYYATLDALVSQINKDIAKAATVIATDKELLNDPYLAALGTDDVFSIVDEQLHFNVCDILPVASNVDELADSITDKCIATDKSKLLHIKNIMNADGTLSNNKYVVLKYNTNEKALDNTLYQYKQIANGLYKQIGIAAAEIEKQSHPYLLKTFNYCEQIYDGTIKMKTAMKLKTIDTTIPADAVMSSSAASYAFLQREIMSNTSVTLGDTFIFNLGAVENAKFREFIGYDTMNEANQALTSLLFANYQLENKMNIGFVGSPNIGSVALNEIKDSNEFKAFSNIFRQGDRIFFISSIFGGTGAAGFPIMVKNIRQAASLEGIENRDALSRAPIGGLTVLPYFTLEGSKQDQRIATSDFIVKTQSALYYYKNTLTGANDSNVNSIYYLGDQVRSKPYLYDPGEHGQRNNAHLIELIGALAPLDFAGVAENKLTDVDGYPLPTTAYEYALAKDELSLNFLSLGRRTRQLIYEPLSKFHLLFLFLTTGFKDIIGQGFTEDVPKIKSDFLASQFYRTLVDHFLLGYAQWLTEMNDNMRSVALFKPGEIDMSHAIEGVGMRKRLLGHFKVDNDVLKAEMNRLSKNNPAYSDHSVEYKLMDLFNKAAHNVFNERYENIN